MKGGSTSTLAHKKNARQWEYLLKFYEKFNKLENRICSVCFGPCKDPKETIVFGIDDGKNYKPCCDSWDFG